MLKPLLRGVAAGAAGTTALNAVTYLDMVLRGRAASSTPEESVRRLAAKTGIPIPGDEEQRSHREPGAGALLRRRPRRRPAAGLPMASMGVSDPREWNVPDWLSDLIPHLAYGLTTATTYAAMTEDD
ncbi:hypothetical protein [Amycolatopsis rifamycinica]|uniref:Uncharacterized protein n=1 Tax=Amycolatopsis rifamycinica TaxID=287986 RepID=A0A066U347_9PSEU|nr:hypothetical protein [Amycolatopsis rifamycinica]KDN21876.1 hypothetical protein DV20_13215 [Amycolatopsis rifamycinica]